MRTESQQLEQVERTIVEPQVGPGRPTRQHPGRTALGIAMIAVGAALTALVIGVTGDSNTKSPPSPGVTPTTVDRQPYQDIDPQLDRLAEQRAAERSTVPSHSLDPQLDRLAERFEAQKTGVPSHSLDPQLDRLAEQRDTRQ